MIRKIYIFMTLTALFICFAPLAVYATQFGDWAGGLQGTTEVFYSNRWLVALTQFVISWISIVGFLMYLMSFLCSALVLSNKEIFWTIDAIKKDQDGSRETKRGPFNGLIEVFRGGAASGLNSGMDNFMVFILAFSLNFKAYSKYKNVEMGDDGGGGAGGGKGPRYSYSDTMGTFFLKETPEAIIVTFVFSIALSGLLVRVWLTVADVLVHGADRFAQQQLIGTLNRWMANMGITPYNFTIDIFDTHPTAQLEAVAGQTFVALAYRFNQNLTLDQIQALGVAVETYFYNFMGGFSPAHVAQEMARRANRPPGASPHTAFEHQQNWGAVFMHATTNSNPNPTSEWVHVINLNDLLLSAGFQPGEGSANLTAGFMHIWFSVNENFT